MSVGGRLRQSFLRTVLPLISPFRGCEPCPARFLPLSGRVANTVCPDFSVDVVYTWVDGNDPVLAAKRIVHLPPEERRDDDAQGENLFRDNQELRYSLRSLEMFAPWVRRVFIVTDGQRPAWLEEHPGIRLVDHEEIIPSEYLPTFSSPVIEAFLHRIPGLGEHYLYFNDDVFLSAPCVPGDFFTPNGLPYLFTDWRRPRRRGYARAATPHSRSHANVRRYLEERGIRPAPALITAHGPFAQTRQNSLDAFAFFSEAVSEFAQDKFRSFRGMAFYCHMVPLWAYALGRGVPCDLPYYYIDVKRPDRRFYYQALLREKTGDFVPFFYCLNDTPSWPGARGWREDMAAFLAACYPEPSAFERPGAPEGGRKERA